jgi:hypothetical protein
MSTTYFLELPGLPQSMELGEQIGCSFYWQETWNLSVIRSVLLRYPMAIIWSEYGKEQTHMDFLRHVEWLESGACAEEQRRAQERETVVTCV